MVGVTAEGDSHSMGFHPPPFVVLTSTLHHKQPHEKLYLMYNFWQDQRMRSHFRASEGSSSELRQKTEFERWMELLLQKAPQCFKLNYQQLKRFPRKFYCFFSMELSDCSDSFNISINTSILTMKVGEVCEKHSLLPTDYLFSSPEGQEKGMD